eukprot:36515-Eustigmatos_ZCMA.PRE.1
MFVDITRRAKQDPTQLVSFLWTAVVNTDTMHAFLRAGAFTASIITGSKHAFFRAVCERAFTQPVSRGPGMLPSGLTPRQRSAYINACVQ